MPPLPPPTTHPIPFPHTFPSGFGFLQTPYPLPCIAFRIVSTQQYTLPFNPFSCFVADMVVRAPTPHPHRPTPYPAHERGTARLFRAAADAHALDRTAHCDDAAHRAPPARRTPAAVAARCVFSGQQDFILRAAWRCLFADCVPSPFAVIWPPYNAIDMMKDAWTFYRISRGSPILLAITTDTTASPACHYRVANVNTFACIVALTLTRAVQPKHSSRSVTFAAGRPGSATAVACGSYLYFHRTALPPHPYILALFYPILFNTLAYRAAGALDISCQWTLFGTVDNRHACWFGVCA